MSESRDLVLIGVQLGSIRVAQRYERERSQRIQATCEEILDAVKHQSMISTSVARPSDVLKERIKDVVVTIFRKAIGLLAPTILMWVGAALLWFGAMVGALLKWLIPLVRGFFGW